MKPVPQTHPQRTLREPVGVAGVGLFSSAPSRVTIRPAGPDEGIAFRRVDLPGAPSVPARIEFVAERPRRTALVRGEAVIETVEHCLAALAGLGVDNALVDVAGPEIPAGDGSAAPFTEAISRVGLVEQDAPRRALTVSAPVTVRDGDASITAMPSDDGATEMVYVMDHGAASAIPAQTFSYVLTPATFIEQIAPARTFSTQAEAEAMWQRGLFRHLTPRDMLVVGPAGPIDNAYRFRDEPVRHKLLDLLGDLSLVGRPIVGRIVAVRSGHALNQRLARELDQRLRTEAAQSGDQSRADGDPAMDIRTILRLLPHRFPMVLIDRVLELEQGRRAVGIKNVTFNEPFFQGHYPDSPIMPGVLIIEAMCQLAGLMVSQQLERDNKIAVLLSLDGVKLRRPVTPGDQLVLESNAVSATARRGEAECRAFVSGRLAAEARIKFLMVDAQQPEG